MPRQIIARNGTPVQIVDYEVAGEPLTSLCLGDVITLGEMSAKIEQTHTITSILGAQIDALIDTQLETIDPQAFAACMARKAEIEALNHSAYTGPLHELLKHVDHYASYNAIRERLENTTPLGQEYSQACAKHSEEVDRSSYSFRIGHKLPPTIPVGTQAVFIYNVGNAELFLEEILNAANDVKNGTPEKDLISKIPKIITPQSGIAYIKEVEVLRAYQSRGFARELFEAALADIEKRRGLPHSYARVLDSNVDGKKIRRLFQQFGFQEVHSEVCTNWQRGTMEGYNLQFKLS